MNNPKLQEPAPGSAWAMVSVHPFYPSAEFFATEAEARAAAEKEIDIMHREGGGFTDSLVFVARVNASAAISTDF